jgi:hypothetical protein
MAEEKGPCAYCTSWGYKDPTPEHVKNTRYSDLCEKHVGPKMKQRSRANLEKELHGVFTRWLISMEEKGLKPSTVNSNRHAAAQFCRWWLEQMPSDTKD